MNRRKKTGNFKSLQEKLFVLLLLCIALAAFYTAIAVTRQIGGRRSRAASCTVNATIAASNCQQSCGESLDCATGLMCQNGICINPQNPTSLTCQGPLSTPTPSPQTSPLPSPSTSTQHPVQLSFVFLNAVSSQSTVTNILSDGSVLTLNGGSILSTVTISGGQSPVYSVNYGSSSAVPQALTFTVSTGAVRLAGYIKDTTTGQILATQPGTQILTVGNWRAGKDGTITRIP
jgi:hypothetical protein